MSEQGPLPPETPRETWYESNGLRLRLLEWGDPDGRPVMLVHGGYDHARSWDPIAARLAQRFRVIVPELRGHGDSDWSVDGHYALIDHIEDLAGAFHHLDLQAAEVLAHSYGGRVALRYAGVYPETVRRLVVIEGLGPIRPERDQWRATPASQRIRTFHDQRRRLAAQPQRSLDSLEACAARMRDRNPRLSPALADHLARHGARKGPDGRFVWKFDRRAGLIHPLDMAAEEERLLFAAIGAPTLLIHGRDSASSPPEGDERVAGMADARTLWVEDAGHWVHHDQPEQVLGALADFLG